MAANASNGFAKFAPRTNVAEDIALEYTDGIPCQSQYNGDQVRFTLTDGRTWFASPADAAKVHQLGVEPGELFRVCKTETMRGNRRAINLQVERLETGAAAQAAPAQAAPEKLVTPQAAPPQSIATAPAPAVPEPAVPAPAVPGAPDPLAKLIAKGQMAIDAVLAIEAYARQRGMPGFQFGADNIQRLWVHLSMQNGGR